MHVGVSWDTYAYPVPAVSVPVDLPRSHSSVHTVMSYDILGVTWGETGHGRSCEALTCPRVQAREKSKWEQTWLYVVCVENKRQV